MVSRDDLMWSAGFLEGEASFGFYERPRVQVSQVQRWPLDRLKALFGGSIGYRRFTQPNHRNAHYWSIGTSRAVGVMMTMYSLLSPERKAKIREVLEAWRGRRPHARYYKQCVHGHAFTPDNTITDPDGHRRCRTCRDRNNAARPRRATACVAGVLALVLAFAFPAFAVDLRTGGGGAPTDAKYLTATTNATLTAEQSIGALTTGLLLNTVAAAEGTLSAYGGTNPCAGIGWLVSLDASGAGTCAAADLATADVTGILGSANGGTGNGFTAFTGPTTAAKTFTLPDASATILTTASSTAEVPQFARLGLGVAADATNLLTLAAAGVIEFDGRAGLASPAAGILNFTDAAGTGHATGLGLGTTTPRTWLSTTVTGATSQVAHASDSAFVVAAGTSSSGFIAVDTNATANQRAAFYRVDGTALDILRLTDAGTAGAIYLSANLATDAVTLGSASVAGLTLNPGSGNVVVSANSLRVEGSGSIGVVNDAGGVAWGAATDLWAYRDAANTLAQRNGANAQTLRVYGTFTDATNYERASLSTTAGSGITLAAETAGTGGDNLGVTVQAAGTGAVTLTGGAGGSLSVTTIVAPAASGTRYLCIDTAGVVTSSASACSGT